MSAIGTVGILNVGAGDTKLVFDVKDPDAMKKAATVVADMIRRGYVIMVELGKDKTTGRPIYRRVKKFRKDTCEYVISEIPNEQTVEAPSARKTTRAIKASGARAVAVPHTAGG